jgi:hypothetical protein
MTAFYAPSFKDLRVPQISGGKDSRGAPVVPYMDRQLSRAQACPGAHTPLRSEEPNSSLRADSGSIFSVR